VGIGALLVGEEHVVKPTVLDLTSVGWFVREGGALSFTVGAGLGEEEGVLGCLFGGPALPGVKVEEAEDEAEEEAAFLVFFEGVLRPEPAAVGVGADDVGEALVLEVLLGVDDGRAGVARVFLCRFERKAAGGGRGRRG
jgi:hypothetical protein